jgi:hypothetical protein
VSVYFVSREGRLDGPYDDEEIDAFLAGGELRFDDWIWREGQTDWREVGAHFPDYALQPPDGDILNSEYLELLESARRYSGRGNPVQLARQYNVPYGIAAWACSEAERRFRCLIKASIQVLLRTPNKPPNRWSFRDGLEELGFLGPNDFYAAVQFLADHNLIVDPKSSFAPFELKYEAESNSPEELIERYASAPRLKFSVPSNERAKYTGERRCLDAGGKLLYVVTSKGRVLDANGTVLGTVMANGDVWSAERQLVGRKADPGLLYALAMNERQR